MCISVLEVWGQIDMKKLKGEKIEERKKLYESQRFKTNNIISKYDMIVFLLIYQMNQTYFSIKYVEG